MTGRIPGPPFPIGSRVIHYNFPDEPATVTSSGRYSTRVIDDYGTDISYATADLSFSEE